MKLVRNLVAALMVLGMVSVQTLSGAESYSLPGANCASEHITESYVSFGNLYNSSNTGGYIACPMVRRAPDTSSVSGITVVVNDQGTVDTVTAGGYHTGAVCCTARSCDENGGSCSISPQVCSTGTGIQPLALASVTGSTNGYAYVRCSHGWAQSGQSAIVSVRWSD